MLRRSEALRWLQHLYVCPQKTCLSPARKHLCQRLPFQSRKSFCTEVPESAAVAFKEDDPWRKGDPIRDTSTHDSKTSHSQSGDCESSYENTFGNLGFGDQFYESGKSKLKAKLPRKSEVEESVVKNPGKRGRKKDKTKKTTSDELEIDAASVTELSSQNSLGDVFGLLVQDELEAIEDQRFENDEGEIDETEQPYRRLSPVNRKHSPTWYGRKIAKLGKQGKVYEAIQVYEDEMLKVDRVMPDAYVFAELIAVVGRVGYTKKAFSLFNQMKKFGIKPVDPIYTSLFNACAHSPWPNDGLKRASHLRHLLKESDHQMSLITYRAAVSAFSKCGDIQQAFFIADEAARLRLKQCPKMISALLMGCISDKEAGFKHAVEVWRLMRRKKIRSDSYLYNLLLRATRECGVGDAKFATELIESGNSAKSDADVPQLLSKNALKVTEENMEQGVEKAQSENRKIQKDSLFETVPESIGASSGETVMERDDNKRWWEYDLKEYITEEVSPAQSESCSISTRNPTEVFDNTQVINSHSIPDILNPKENFDNVVSLGDLSSSEARLGLLGGLNGFLAHMKKDRVSPNIKTFSLLLDVIPPTPRVEQELLDAMTALSVKPDIDFMNLLIRKKNLRKDKAGVQEVAELIGEHRLSPNIMTYGCMAMGCHNVHEAKKLLKEMHNAGVTPNTDIFTIMVVQSKMDFDYKHFLCAVMKNYHIPPSESMINSMEHYVKQAWSNLIASEKGQPVSDYFKSAKFKDGFRIFMKFYKPWLRSMPLEQKTHPWAAYRAPVQDEVETTPKDNLQAQAGKRS